MVGDPNDVTFSRDNLVETTCGANQPALAARLEARVRSMRRSVDAALAEWQSLRRCTGREGHWHPPFRDPYPREPIAGDNALFDRVEVHPNRWDYRDWHRIAGHDPARVSANDGAFTYLARDGALRIFETESGRLRSVTALPGEPYQLLLYRDRAVVLASVWDGRQRPFSAQASTGLGSSTEIVVLDLSRRDRPSITRSVELSGRLLASRRSGTILHAVVADGERFPETTLARPEDLLPTVCRDWEPEVRASFVALARNQEATMRHVAPRFPTLTERGSSRQLCQLMTPWVEDPRPFVTLISLDLDQNDRTPETLTIPAAAAFFLSDTALYVAPWPSGTAASWYDFCSIERASTPVHKFSLGPAPAAGRYVGTGALPWARGKAPLMDDWCSPVRDLPRDSVRAPRPAPGQRTNLDSSRMYATW